MKIVANKIGKRAGFLAVFLAWAFFGVLGVYGIGDVFATTSTITMTIDGNDTATTTLSMNLLPTTAAGTFAKSSNTTIGVTTDNFSGYTLGIKADSTSATPTSLVDTNNNTFTTISSALTESDFSAESGTDYNNKWGYMPSQYITYNNSIATVVPNTGDNAVFLPSPTTSGDTLAKTNAANVNNAVDEYTIAIGARATINTPIGAYSNTFIITAVANLIDYSISYNKNTTETVSNMPSSATTGSADHSTTTIPLSSNVPTRTDGYAFLGWCSVATVKSGTTDTCSGTVYNPDGGGTNLNYTINQIASNTNITLYAMWGIPPYVITWDNNYSGSNLAANTTTNVYSGSAVVLPSTPTAPTTQCNGQACYSSFKEWNTKADGSGSTVTASTVPTGDTTYYAIWNFNSNTLQSVTAATCPTSATTVYDARDGEAYKIQKLADNNCWLLDNLRLGGDTAITLKAGDTNSETRETGRDANANGVAVNAFTLPANGAWTSSTQNSYNVPYIASSGDCNNTYCTNTPTTGKWTKDSTTTTYGAGSGKVGVYYNYCAASAGTYCYNSGAGTGDASYSVCPAGWKMPTGDQANGSYYYLFNTGYSGNKTATNSGSLQYNLSTPLSGYFNAGKANNQSYYGYFWSSSRYNGSNMYYLYVNASDVTPQDVNIRHNGYSVRCMIKAS